MADPFRLKDVDHRELTSLLLRHYGSASGIAPRVSRLQKQGAKHHLDIHFDKLGGVAKIVPSPGFPPRDLRLVGSKIQTDLVEDAGLAFGFRQAFCDATVDGFFRYLDVFQVLPIPAGSALPVVAVGDHPFLLQLAYRRSPDHVISALRLSRAALKLTRLLGVLLNDRVHMGSRWTQFDWVIDPSDPTRPTSRWSQLGYWFTNPHSDKRFVDTSAIKALSREPFRDYYSSARYRSTNPLKLPDNLESSLMRASRLDPVDRDRLELASIAFQGSSQLVADSTSAAYVSLVTAVETLMREDSIDKCELCGQPRYRLSQRFRQFIEKYAPMIRDDPIAKERLYRTRSAIAHGTDILEVDREPFGWSISSRRWEEDQLYRKLQSIVGIAIYNWLWSRELRRGEN